MTKVKNIIIIMDDGGIFIPKHNTDVFKYAQVLVEDKPKITFDDNDNIVRIYE